MNGPEHSAGPSIMCVLRRVLGYFFPATCSFCRSPIGDSPVPYFCKSCWGDLTPVPSPVCPRCGRSFGSPEALAADPAHECWSCRTEPPEVDQALAAGLFEGPLREAIHVYKYRPLRALGRPLAAWMCGHVRITAPLDVVMPVPLHRSRLRERGFNQALLLARGVSEAFSIPLRYDALLRTRATRPQVALTGRERKDNVAGAFAVMERDLIAGKRVLLVDDVLTTGATMNECARVLRECGADAVVALTLARTSD
jgi:ComF family protein